MKRNSILGSLLLTLVAVIWGTAFVFQRAGMDQITPITFVASRMTISAVAVGVVTLLPFLRSSASGSTGTPRFSRSELTGGLLCGVFLSIASIFQQMGIVYTPAGKAGFITAMYILLVPVIRFLMFRKKTSWHVWLAVGIGIVGMYFLCMTQSLRLTRGDVLICICALLFSGHILCCDFSVERGNAVRISAIQFFSATLISWIAAFILEKPSFSGIVSAAVPILYCGAISGGVGYTLQIVAQRHTDPTIASLLMSLESVFAVIAGALILRERMQPKELIGCIIMFAAIVLAQIPQKRKSASSGGPS
ncbi:MAG: DMT family transporter [Oscillospiraceae bacterium]|nr:DMT family transporter [Oscillospiraceae bacterium]